MTEDPPDIRASHADRDRVVDALRIAGGDGRLDAEELDLRLEQALTARTLGELARLTADLAIVPTAADVRVIEQDGGKFVREGRWLVPEGIILNAQHCRMRLDFTRAVITGDVLRIEMDVVHGKLLIVTAPGIVVDGGALHLMYAKVKLRAPDALADARLRIELTGRLVHSKVVERRS